MTATTAPTPIAPLTRPETTLLQAAAADGGRLTLPATLKPATRARLLGRFLRDALVSAPDTADKVHRLTAAGYRAVGLTPPEPPRAAEVGAGAPTDVPADAAGPSAPNRKAQVLALLGREQGATLAELTAATGWLPHTARAALSRIRTGGQALVKTARPDAATAYRIPAPVAPLPRARKPRQTRVTQAATTATADVAR